MLVFLNLMTRDLFSALMSLFFSLISAHLQQVDNLTSLVQRSAQYAFQPFGLSAQALQGSPLYCSCLFPLILFIFSPSGLGSLSPLGSCLHTCIVTLGLAASLTSTMASVILLELPTSLPAPQVFSPFPSFPFHLLLPNLLSLSGSFWKAANVFLTDPSSSFWSLWNISWFSFLDIISSLALSQLSYFSHHWISNCQPTPTS